MTTMLRDPAFRAYAPEFDEVYRHEPRSETATVVADGFDKPNGLAFSTDDRTL